MLLTLALPSYLAMLPVQCRLVLSLSCAIPAGLELEAVGHEAGGHESHHLHP